MSSNVQALEVFGLDLAAVYWVQLTPVNREQLDAKYSGRALKALLFLSPRTETDLQTLRPQVVIPVPLQLAQP